MAHPLAQSPANVVLHEALTGDLRSYEHEPHNGSFISWDISSHPSDARATFGGSDAHNRWLDDESRRYIDPNMPGRHVGCRLPITIRLEPGRQGGPPLMTTVIPRSNNAIPIRDVLDAVCNLLVDNALASVPSLYGSYIPSHSRIFRAESQPFQGHTTLAALVTEYVATVFGSNRLWSGMYRDTSYPDVWVVRLSAVRDNSPWVRYGATQTNISNRPSVSHAAAHTNIIWSPRGQPNRNGWHQ